MDLPFTENDFLDIFTRYNTAIQPVQIVAYLLGIAAIALAVRNHKSAGVIILSILAILWAWTGIAYHILFFSSINNAAYAFGALFIVQSLLFVYTAIRAKPLRFHPGRNMMSLTGTVLIIYATIVYPILNLILGHHYPQMPVFGVTPCPMTIFTFGMLLWSTTPVPYYLIAIPAAWSIIGLSAAINLKIYEDFGLIVAGLLGAILIVINNRRTHY